MQTEFDTIAAISTAPGEGAIGIVRISGEDAIRIADEVYRLKEKRLNEQASHTIHYGHIVDPKNDEVIDEVMVTVLRAPKTFTREDIVEINCHGGIVAINRILQLVLRMGARLAEPGEFTKRAFLKGRIDLSQAEAVMDLIRAKTDKSMQMAMRQLDGELSKLIQNLRQEILNTLAQVEVNIDYPEYDDVEEMTLQLLREKTEQVSRGIRALLNTASQGKILRDGLKTAIVGRPNVGKSSLVNAMLGEERVIVSNVAGTTRDAIDTTFEDEEGTVFKMIDTAGIRKKGRVFESTEKYSVLRALRAIERSDIVCVVLNAEEGIREYDKRIAGFAHEAGKGMIIVVNKWDTLEKDNHTMKDWEEDIRDQFQYLSYAPIIFVSALTKQRLHKLPDMIKQISQSQNTRIPSAVLNDVIMDAIAINPTPTDKGKRLKIFYATQVATKPPTFVIFVNEEELMHFSYLRFLENQIRKAFVFEGTPIHLIARKRK